MAKVENSYVIADKRYRDYRAYIFTSTWADNKDDSVELSRLPAGEYLVGLYFILEAKVSQDGNGTDAIDHMQLLDFIDRVTISNGSNNHLNYPLYAIAQLCKLSTGQNPLLPDDIAASTGASTVNTEFAAIIPYWYSQWQFKRPHDFAYPTTLLQDGNLAIHWATGQPAGHASNAWVSATLKVVALTKRLNRATIPPEPDNGYVETSSLTCELRKGNYNRVWMSHLDLDSMQLFTALEVNADGLPLTAIDTDHFNGVVNLDWDYRDDELQINIVSPGDFIDKNIPPQPTSAETIERYFQPILGGNYISKIAEIVRVENSLMITVTGTACTYREYWQRFQDHTESGLDARAKVMGFGSGSVMVPRTHRRALGAGDVHLSNLLPVRLVQAAPTGKA